MNIEKWRKPQIFECFAGQLEKKLRTADASNITELLSQEGFGMMDASSPEYRALKLELETLFYSDIVQDFSVYPGSSKKVDVPIKNFAPEKRRNLPFPFYSFISGSTGQTAVVWKFDANDHSIWVVTNLGQTSHDIDIRGMWLPFQETGWEILHIFNEVIPGKYLDLMQVLNKKEVKISLVVSYLIFGSHRQQKKDSFFGSKQSEIIDIRPKIHESENGEVRWNLENMLYMILHEFGHSATESFVINGVLGSILRVEREGDAWLLQVIRGLNHLYKSHELASPLIDVTKAKNYVRDQLKVYEDGLAKLEGRDDGLEVPFF